MGVSMTTMLAAWVAGTVLSFYVGQMFSATDLGSSRSIAIRSVLKYYFPASLDETTSMLKESETPSKDLEFSIDETDAERVISKKGRHGHGQRQADDSFRLPNFDEKYDTTDTDVSSRQSNSRNRATAEMLVHPALFAHPEPNRVAVIVGADGPSPYDIISEALKHSSIKFVSVLVVSGDDSTYQEATKDTKHLSPWQGGGSDATSGTIVEANSKVFYDTEEFYNSLPTRKVDIFLFDDSTTARGSSNDEWLKFSKRRYGIGILSSTGILVTFVGKRYNIQVKRRTSLIETGYLRVLDFNLGRPNDRRCSGCVQQLPFVIAFKAEKTVSRWHLTEAHWALEIFNRLKRPTLAPEDATKEARIHFPFDDVCIPAYGLILFDSTTMLGLEYPQRIRESEYCAFESPDDPLCEESKFDQNIPDTPLDQLYVAQSSIGKNAGRGVFANVHIPAGSYIGSRSTAFAVQTHWTTHKLIMKMMDENVIYMWENDRLIFYLGGYGVVVEPWEEPMYWVDSGILAFVNHGCNRSYNVGAQLPYDESSADANSPPAGMFFRKKLYNPLGERSLWSNGNEEWQTRNFKDLNPGDELFDNYLGFGGTTYWSRLVRGLKDLCSGGLGEIEVYQNQDKDVDDDEEDEDDDEDDEDDDDDDEDEEDDDEDEEDDDEDDEDDDEEDDEEDEEEDEEDEEDDDEEDEEDDDEE